MCQKILWFLQDEVTVCKRPKFIRFMLRYRLGLAQRRRIPAFNGSKLMHSVNTDQAQKAWLLVFAEVGVLSRSILGTNDSRVTASVLQTRSFVYNAHDYGDCS